MLYISVDVESDGPAPGVASMIALGAAVVEPGVGRTFGATLRPISDGWDPKALAVSGYTREQTLAFEDPASVMRRFAAWVDEVAAGGRVWFVSDNAGFDWMFVCYYFHRFVGRNPFGWSALSLTSLYKGYAKDMRANFRHLRKTCHSHDPVDDAKGNAEALMALFEKGLRR